MSEEAEQPQPTDDSVADELCMSCLHPNEPDINFCAKCGAPLTFYSTSAPFVSVFAEGHVYRQCTEKPRSLIVVFGIWLLFAPPAVLGAAWLIFSRYTSLEMSISMSLMVPISIAIIWKTTRSYLARPPVVESETE